VLGESVALNSAINQVNFLANPEGELALFPGDVQASVRHGFVPTGSGVPGIPPINIDHDSYLIDLDLFIVAAQRWNVDTFGEQFNALHSQIDRFFRWALAEEGATAFGLEELS
jgi:uncharacterized protein (TIGR04255 family)